ncbi:DMT family transporter [Desulfovibrio sp. OttesenSCG-928-C14]|nr:DMT family transporter [Desulfovibrio sp. OttesenSCG-928-C14]
MLEESPETGLGRFKAGVLGAVKGREQLFGSICAVAATMIWSGNFIAGRALADTIPPMTLVVVRSIIAFAVLLPFALPQFKRDWPLIRKNLGYFSLLTLMGASIPHSCVYIAAHSTQAINLSIIAISTPLFVLLLGRIFYGEVLTGTRLLGLVITIVGILLLLSRGSLEVLRGLKFNPGDLIMMGNSIGFALYTIYLRKMPRGVGMLSFMLAFCALGGLFVVPGMVWELASGQAVHFTPKLITGLLYTSIGCTLLTYIFWNLAVAWLGAAKTSLLYNLIPLFSAVGSILILGEPVLGIHFVSMILIVSGIVLAIHVKKKRS